METIWQDIRYGVRMLVKHRLTTLVCVVALALGIGANTAMFSLAEAFLLHPVPFENANRLVALVDSHATPTARVSVKTRVPLRPPLTSSGKRKRTLSMKLQRTRGMSST